MALVKCKECKHEISKKAKKCPNCGAPIKRTSIVTIFIGLLFAVIIFNVVVQKSNKTVTTSSSQRTKSIDALSFVKTKAKLASEHIKKAQRNPNSYKLEKVFYAEKSKALCFEYRSQNGFGGVNLVKTVLQNTSNRFISSEEDGFVNVWNSECAGKGHDISYAVK